MTRPDLRDRYLILIGLLSTLLGISYTAKNLTVEQSLHPILEHVPLPWFAAAWIFTGAYCVVAAFTNRDIRGFGVASVMPAFWGSAYALSWLDGYVHRGWVTAAIFWALGLSVYCVAGLIDPTPVVSRKTR